MFKRNNKNQKEQNSRQAVFSEDMIVEGGISTKDSLLIFGKIFGDITSNSLVEIESSGKVYGSISANDVIIKGFAQGEVEANCLKILNGGIFRGKTKTKNLIVEANAEFEASSQMLTCNQENDTEDKNISKEDIQV